MAENNPSDLLGGGLASLLQNPEITAKLPRILEALGPVMAEMQSESAPTPVEAAPVPSLPSGEVKPASGVAAAPDALLTKLLGTLGKPREESARRSALLKALSPYLSDSRREALEYICKVSGLLDILSEVM